HPQPCGRPPHTPRHLPEHRHSGDRGGLAIHRPQPGGDGRADHDPVRASPDDDGRQHRAHRIDDRERPGDGQDLPAAACAPRYRQRAGDGGVADYPAPAASRHPAAVDHQLQRVDGAILQLALSGLSEAELNDLPVKVVGNSTIYLRDVAHVRDGFAPQTNVVRRDGSRGTLVTILKTGTASTLDVVAGIRALLPRVIQTLPPQLTVQPLADQSIFVRAAVSGVIREAVIAACLTAAMILLFLGSWRSTLIIAVSIPLSILTSVITLSLLGETINIMTLGGLALAVGILVDDATVEVENINRNLDMGKPIIQAILDGAQQIAVPALVSTP